MAGKTSAKLSCNDKAPSSAEDGSKQSLTEEHLKRPRLFVSSGPFLVRRPGRAPTTIVCAEEVKSSEVKINSQAFSVQLNPKAKVKSKPSKARKPKRGD